MPDSSAQDRAFRAVGDPTTWTNTKRLAVAMACDAWHAGHAALAIITVRHPDGFEHRSVIEVAHP